MTIIEDSRQQKGKHDAKTAYFTEAGVELYRSKLAVGDYALPPRISVDTKRSISEIAQNICGTAKEHQRFKRECIAAKEMGTQLVILIENEDDVVDLTTLKTWVNPRSVIAPNCVQGERLAKAMITMSERYGVLFKFCKPEDSGQRIMEILLSYVNEY